MADEIATINFAGKAGRRFGISILINKSLFNYLIKKGKIKFKSLMKLAIINKKQ